MMLRPMPRFVLAVQLLLIEQASAVNVPLPETYKAMRLGDVDFNVSTQNMHAREWFKYGLMHLLTFGYDYATPAFQRSYENDPDFALPYAFEALTHFWPLWSKDDAEAANAVLEKMPAASDPREALYIDAISRHFKNGSSVEVRNADGVAALAQLVTKYPEDASAHAFLGLWRLALSTLQSNAEQDTTLQGAEVAISTALSLDPNHVGALHYQLHLYDNPADAKKGLLAAALMPQVAPDASHSAHMPVHIFLRLFNFSACFDADDIAVAAADKCCQIHGMGDDEACDLWNLYHSLEYLQYSAVQIGRWRDATKAFERMTANLTSARAKNHPQVATLELWWARMEARRVLFDRGMVLLTGQDSDLESIECRSPAERVPGFWRSHTESGVLLAHGLCYALKHRPGNSSSDPMRKEMVDIRTRLAEIPVEFGPLETRPSDHYIHKVNSMHVHMFDAADHFIAGDLNSAWMEADKAIEIEDKLEPTADSPTILFIGAHEFKGMLLLMNKDVESAKLAGEQFEKAIRRQGPQLSTLLGAARAKRLQHCGDDAKEAYETVADFLDSNSDGPDLPFWDELQEGLALSGKCGATNVDVSGSRGAASAIAALAGALALFALG